MHLVLTRLAPDAKSQKRMSYPIPVLQERLVVAARSDQEEDDVDIVEGVDPLFAFGSLTTNIDHAVRQAGKIEDRFADTGGSQSSSEDVLIGRKI